MAKQLDLSKMDRRAIELIAKASEKLRPEEHHPECPVHHGASVDCLWPLVACVPDDFDLEAEYPHE